MADYLSPDVDEDLDRASAIGRSRAYQSQGFLPPARYDQRPASPDLFEAPVAPAPRRTKAPSTDPLKNPQFVQLHNQRQTLRQTEQLYHQQLEDFDKGEGASIRAEHDPETGRLIRPGPAQQSLQGMIDRSHGDTSTGLVPPEVRQAAKNLKLLKEKRDRIKSEAERVSQARAAFDQQVYLPARNAILGTTDGLEVPTEAPAPTRDYMAPTGDDWASQKITQINQRRQRTGEAPIAPGTISAGDQDPQAGQAWTRLDTPAPPGPKTGGGEPTPPPTPTQRQPTASSQAPAPAPKPEEPESQLDSLNRIRGRRAEYQAQLDAGGDNLRQDVRDRLKGQVSLLDSKIQQNAMDQLDAVHRQVWGHVTGAAADGKAPDPQTISKAFDQYKTLGQIYAEHQGAVVDAANKPNISIPRWEDKPDDSALAAATKGAIDGLDSVAEGLTSNSNVLLLGSIGTIAKAAELGWAPARAVMQTAQGLFTKQMAEGTYEAGKKAYQDIRDPKVGARQTASDVTQTLANAFLTAGSVHGLKNEIGAQKGPAAVDELPTPKTDSTPKPGEPIVPPPPREGTTPPPDQAPPAGGSPTPPPAPRPPTDSSPVPVDEDLSSSISKLRQEATRAEAPAPAAAPAPAGEAGELDHKIAGYDTREDFQRDYEEKGQHDSFETEEEYLKRVYCSQLGRGNFSIK